ncbi:type II toxin-antitoxin system VapC family toxin [Ilyomonas limi]|uniref:Type II toxin-antitoxin system VapC family toxin n=1 Tax=Ilyomonas limi TaxID=2575867 RepID=A0A4U3KZ97_9BACT|nr:type II toxin-antitoxin system VapC family toxin [Ilyomonas limi]TKK67772.1 type II toxin-antitoxin system VapC family toxin [Ilyomonas limi]
MEYLIDSNVLINYAAERFSEKQIQLLDSIFDVALNLSVISKIEVLGYNMTTAENQYFSKLFLTVKVFQMNENIVEKTIELRKTLKIKIPDALIAATALTNDYTLLTRNKTDFSKVPGLQIMNPHEW